MKVWINSNFSLNSIEEEIVNKGDRISKEKLENFMVEQLLAELRIKAVDVGRVDEIKEQMGREGIKDFDQVLMFINKEGEFRGSFGPRSSGNHRMRKVEEEVVHVETPRNIPPPVHILPQRYLSTTKLQSHQSPPPRIEPKPI